MVVNIPVVLPLPQQVVLLQQVRAKIISKYFEFITSKDWIFIKYTCGFGTVTTPTSSQTGATGPSAQQKNDGNRNGKLIEFLFILFSFYGTFFI